MARDLAAAFITALNTKNTRPRIFFEGEFSGGTLRLWNGTYTVTWNGQSWLGAGNMLGVSAVEETSELRAVAFTVSLNGAKSTLISTALQECRQGLDGTVWLGLLDDAGAIIADPFTAFKGKLDVPDIVDGGDACSITVRYESRLIDLEKVRARYYDHEDQQIDVPGDNGFKQVQSLQDAVIAWGGGG